MSRTILFAPGAGAPSSSGWMVTWAERLAALGRIVPMDYDYMLRGSKRPDPQPKLIARHREELAKITERPVVLCGKSMGSRMGCHVSLEEPVAALVCFGYPLRGQNGKLRDEVLLALRTPILFIQGTKDPLCPLDELGRVRGLMQAPNTLHVVEGGDHSLVLSRSRSKAAIDKQAAADAAMFEAVQSHFAQFAP